MLSVTVLHFLGDDLMDTKPSHEDMRHTKQVYSKITEVSQTR